MLKSQLIASLIVLSVLFLAVTLGLISSATFSFGIGFWVGWFVETWLHPIGRLVSWTQKTIKAITKA